MKASEFSLELEKLGKRIRQVRKHRKLRLLDLEILSKINDSDLSRYEQGNIEFQTIFKLAKVLEVDVKILLDYDGPLPDNSNFKGLGKKELKKKSKSLPLHLLRTSIALAGLSRPVLVLKV